MLDFKKIQWYKSFNVWLVFYSCEFAKVHTNPFVYWSVYIFIYKKYIYCKRIIQSGLQGKLCRIYYWDNEKV